MVQRLFTLSDSAGAFELTVEAYLRPSGLPIERHVAGVDSARGGVWPDPGMTVPQADDEGAAPSRQHLEADDFGLLSESRLPPSTPDADAALAHARTALLAG